jgi:hypothetical protein
LSHERDRFVSINYLTFPGLTDSLDEIAALTRLIETTGLDMIQWRNLNIDPDAYVETIGLSESERAIGMRSLFDQLRQRFPGVRHGYVNPPREAWRDAADSMQHRRSPGLQRAKAKDGRRKSNDRKARGRFSSDAVA